MRTYPLFNGEAPSTSFVVSMEERIHNILETQCREAWREMFRLSPDNRSASPFVPYSEWSRTTEGRTHEWLLHRQFIIKGAVQGHTPVPGAECVSNEEFAALYARLQARRRNVRGTRKQYAPGHQDLKAYRKFRSWWLSGRVAESLGISFDEPCPVTRPEIGLPTESYIEIGQHFEEWTGHRLAPQLWDELKSMEAKRLVAERQAAERAQQETEEQAQKAA